MSKVFSAVLTLIILLNSALFVYADSDLQATEEISDEQSSTESVDLFASLTNIVRGKYLFVTKSQMLAAGYTNSDDFRDAVIANCKAMNNALYSQNSGKGGSGEAVDCITYVQIAYAAALNKISNLYTASNRLVHFTGSCKNTGAWKLYTTTGSTGCTYWLALHGIGTSRYSNNVFKQGAPVYNSVDNLNIKRGDIVFWGGWNSSTKTYRWLHTGIYDGEGSMFWQARSTSIPTGLYERKEINNPNQTNYKSTLVLHIEDFDLSEEAALLESTPSEYSSYKWINSSGKWYCQDSDGEYVTGLASIGKTLYLFDDSGIMKTGWQLYCGRWFYCASDGSVKRGWVKLGSRWYLFNSYGVMVTGLNMAGGSLYYLAPSGEMVTGWRLVDGKWYYFNKSGAACFSCWKRFGSTWYYFDKDSVMVTGVCKVDGKYYLFGTEGDMKTGWTLTEGEWFYHKKSGEAVSGWYTVGGTKYCFDNTGMMLHDTEVDGIKLGSDGKIIVSDSVPEEPEEDIIEETTEDITEETTEGITEEITDDVTDY